MYLCCQRMKLFALAKLHIHFMSPKEKEKNFISRSLGVQKILEKQRYSIDLIYIMNVSYQTCILSSS